MGATKTVTATEFQTTCLDLPERLEGGEVSRIEGTKRGRVVAVIVAPRASASGA